MLSSLHRSLTQPHARARQITYTGPRSDDVNVCGTAIALMGIGILTSADVLATTMAVVAAVVAVVVV